MKPSAAQAKWQLHFFGVEPSQFRSRLPRIRKKLGKEVKTAKLSLLLSLDDAVAAAANSLTFLIAFFIFGEGRS